MDIGRHHTLKILRSTSVGLYLGNEEHEDVLLPNKYCPKEFEIGDELEVFVYLDYAERPVATNLKPKILLNEFGFLKVNSVSKVGAFMDWGLEKDLMVPFKEQRQKLEEGRWYIVYMDLDEKTNRLYASNKPEKFLQNNLLTVEEGEEVDLLVLSKTDLGFSVIVNNMHKGLIFYSEVYKPLNVGDTLKGIVKQIREDNKLDITIRKTGYENVIEPNSKVILEALEAAGGMLPFSDKSTPEDIIEQFNMSKKNFKKALGALYKEKVISISPDKIELL